MTVRDYWTPMFVNLGKPDVMGEKLRRGPEAPNRSITLDFQARRPVIPTVLDSRR